MYHPSVCIGIAHGCGYRALAPPPLCHNEVHTSVASALRDEPMTKILGLTFPTAPPHWATPVGVRTKTECRYEATGMCNHVEACENLIKRGQHPSRQSQTSSRQRLALFDSPNPRHLTRPAVWSVHQGQTSLILQHSRAYSNSRMHPHTPLSCSNCSMLSWSSSLL